MQDKFQLPQSLHNEIFKGILKDELDASTSVQSPKIVILGGQPGSGKSKIFDFAKNNIFNNNNVVSINGDDYRSLHPQANEIFALYDKRFAEFTDPDVRLWTSGLLEACVNNKRNIIVETTMRNQQPLASTISKLKHIGYTIALMVSAVQDKISRVNIVKRYEEQRIKYGIGRWTPFEIHDEAYHNFPKNVSFFENSSPIDSITVFDRNVNILYNIESNSNCFVKSIKSNSKKNAFNSILNVRQQPLNTEDIKYITNSVEFIRKAMIKRDALEEFLTLSKILLSKQKAKDLKDENDEQSNNFKPRM
jgi:predicted ABC-type ATPase